MKEKEKLERGNRRTKPNGRRNVSKEVEEESPKTKEKENRMNNMSFERNRYPRRNETKGIIEKERERERESRERERVEK